MANPVYYEGGFIPYASGFGIFLQYFNSTKEMLYKEANQSQELQEYLKEMQNYSAIDNSTRSKNSNAGILIKLLAVIALIFGIFKYKKIKKHSNKSKRR